MNQASSLGEALKHEPVTHIYSSDLKRAYRTAGAVAQHHPHVAVVRTQKLREQDFGDLEGKPWRTTWSTAKTGESSIAMKERAVSAWHWILQEANVYENETDLFVVLVSHGLFLGTLFTTICAFYNFPRPANIFWNNTAYLRFVVDASSDPAFNVKCVNNTGHLTAVQRQKGGVGSSKFDDSQKTMKDFFVTSPKKPGTKPGKSPLPPLPMPFFPL
jgi:broad specificity phosphatase PhoE